MKLRKRNAIAAILLAGLMLMLPACSGGGGGTTSQGGAAGGTQSAAPAGGLTDKPVSLKFYGYGLMSFCNVPGYEDSTQNLGDIYKVITDKYIEAHPNVEVSIEVINPAGGNTEQLDVDIASGNIPDMYLDNQMRIAKYEGLGLIANLRDYLDAAIFDDYVDGTFVEGGSAWRLPIDMSPHFIVVNKTMFEKIGKLDLLPKEDDREWTTDQFMAALDAVKAANLDGVYPTILWAANPSGDVCNMGYLWGFGARMFENGDYSKSLLGSEATVKAWTFLNNLAQNYSVPGAAALNDDDMLAMFPKGQVAVTGGYSYLEGASAEAEEPFEAYSVNYPHEDGQPNPPIAVHMNSVSVFKSDDADKTAVAADLAAYIAGEDWAPLLCNASGTQSPRKSFSSQIVQSDNNKAIDAMIQKNGVVDFGATCSKFQEIRNLYAPELQAMFTGAKTPEQAVADLAAAVDKLLADN